MQDLEGLLLLEGAEPYRNSWNELKNRITKLGAARQVNVDNQHIAKLAQAVEALVSNQKKQAPAAPATYAAVLKNLPALSGPPAVREIPTRLARELVVACPDASPQDRGRPVKQIVEEINKLKGSTVPGKVLAARRLPSGDVLITTDTAEAKEQLERSQNWLPAVGQTAIVNRRRFTVLVHGMRTSALDCSKQEDAVKELLGQNQHLRGRVEILRARWPRRAVKLGKPVSHLIVDVATPAQANLLIEEGLLFHSELKDCELYHGDCRLTQCFNCQSYGHTAKVCRGTQKCGACAAPGHSDHNCALKGKPSAHRCANCNLGHPAWSSKCKERKEQIGKARLAYATRPRMFALTTNYNPRANTRLPTPPPFSFSQASQTPQGNSQGSAEPWQIVKRRRVGSRSAPRGQTLVGIASTPRSTAPSKHNQTETVEVVRETPAPSQTSKGPGRPPNRPHATEGDQDIADFFPTQEMEL
jgi:hypothetical protein